MLNYLNRFSCVVLNVNLLRTSRWMLIKTYTDQEIVQVQKKSSFPLVCFIFLIFGGKYFAILRVLLWGPLIKIKDSKNYLLVIFPLIKIFGYPIKI